MADLITVEEYKAYKGIGKSDKDEQISLIIKTVSALIKAYVGHGITDNWDEPVTVDINTPYDTKTLYLDAYPIRNIVSVEEAFGGYVGGLDSTIHYPMSLSVDYNFSYGAGAIHRIGGTWSRNVRVTYRAGYETTPDQIKFAAIEIVSYYLNEEWKPARTMQGTSIAGPTAEAGGIPKHIVPMLSEFKVGM